MANYKNIVVSTEPGILTHIPELDKFVSFDGGFDPESVIFLTGTSGAGKTTLCKLIQRNMKDTKTEMLQKETSIKAISKQLKRIVIDHDNASVEDKKSVQDFLRDVEANGTKFIIIDSLQSCYPDFPELSDEAAAMAVYKLLREWGKRTGGVSILIGFVKKDGDFMGGNAIKQLTDAHIEMIFDVKKNERYIICSKSRIGGAVGIPLFYGFVNNDEILEFSYDRADFEQTKKELNEYLLTALNQYVKSLKKIDKIAYDACRKEAKKISNSTMSEDQMIIAAIEMVQRTVKLNVQLKLTA